MKNNKYFKGFTLLELLIVIAIIGILAGIIFASVSSARAAGRDTKKITEMKSMINAINIFYNTNGYYPQTSTSLVPIYIPELPDNVYYIGLNGAAPQCGSYHIGVTLEKNNVVLNNDKDFSSTNTGVLALVPPGNLCGNITGFNADSIRGDDIQSCKGTVVEPAGGKCYDLVP